MARTVRDHLLDALEDLLAEELRKFKAKLNEIPLREGFANIPRGKLQEATPVDLSDLLLSYYTDSYAAEVAAQVLESIHLKRQAEKLRAAAGIGENGSVQNPVQSPRRATGRHGPQEPTPEESHFVDKHRAALIQRTSTVEAVLDLLHGNVLTDEQYERIRSQRTNTDKMRELYGLMPSWNRSCKDQLYEALKATNRFLVEDLKERGGCEDDGAPQDHDTWELGGAREGLLRSAPLTTRIGKV